jgi:Tat protein secretion system quality control protein TatD with DNase activity
MSRRIQEADSAVGAKWLTGTAGMPRSIEGVVTWLTKLRGTTVEVIEQTIQANFGRLFRGDARFARIHRKVFGGSRSGDNG